MSHAIHNVMRISSRPSTLVLIFLVNHLPTYYLIRKTTKSTLTQCIMTNSCFYTLSCAKPCFCSTHNAAGLLRGRVTACLFQFSAFENREAKKEELSQIDFGNEYELSSFPTQLRRFVGVVIAILNLPMFLCIFYGLVYKIGFFRDNPKSTRASLL